MESKQSPQPTKYLKKLEKLLSEKGLTDIIVFGSTVKKGPSHDIDIALILQNPKTAPELKKKIRNTLNKETDIHILSHQTIYTPLWLTLIKEGYSIAKKKYLHEIYRIKPVVLYKYSLKKLTNTQKVQFTRGLNTLLGKDGIKLTRTVIIVPITKQNLVEDLLRRWNILYDTKEYELLPTLRKEELP